MITKLVLAKKLSPGMKVSQLHTYRLWTMESYHWKHNRGLILLMHNMRKELNLFILSSDYHYNVLALFIGSR